VFQPITVEAIPIQSAITNMFIPQNSPKPSKKLSKLTCKDTDK